VDLRVEVSVQVVVGSVLGVVVAGQVVAQAVQMDFTLSSSGMVAVSFSKLCIYNFYMNIRCVIITHSFAD